MSLLLEAVPGIQPGPGKGLDLGLAFVQLDPVWEMGTELDTGFETDIVLE
jgi:hypothetical protein